MPKTANLSIIVGLFIVISTSRALAHDTSVCEFATLPADFQQRLKTDFSSWKIQEVSNLSEPAKVRWKAEKPLSCPGIAVGEFERPNQLSYAVLLVPIGNSDAAFRLIVFTSSANNTPSTLRIVESGDNGGIANSFIHSVGIHKVFSAEWIRKLKVKQGEAVLVIDSGKDEYEVDVYFWSDGQYHHEAIDY